MIRPLLRCALVAVTATLLTQLPMAAPAQATGTCGTGTPFVVTAAGEALTDETDWWQTVSPGSLQVSVEATDWAYLDVFDSSCGQLLCSSGPGRSHGCEVSYVGRVNISVRGYAFGAAYVLTAIPLPGNVTPPPPGSCNLVEVLGVCANLSTGSVVQEVSVPGVTLGSAGSHRVAGYVDRYRFITPGGVALVLPCVVLTANATTVNPCAAAGGTFDSRFLTLLDNTVSQPTVGVGDPILTARVCDARVTLTAAGFGVENFGLLTVC